MNLVKFQQGLHAALFLLLVSLIFTNFQQKYPICNNKKIVLKAVKDQ